MTQPVERNVDRRAPGDRVYGEGHVPAFDVWVAGAEAKPDLDAYRAGAFDVRR